MPGLIAPPTGIVKPHPWPVDPLATAAPWFWRNGPVFVVPYWGLDRTLPAHTPVSRADDYAYWQASEYGLVIRQDGSGGGTAKYAQVRVDVPGPLSPDGVTMLSVVSGLYYTTDGDLELFTPAMRHAETGTETLYLRGGGSAVTVQWSGNPDWTTSIQQALNTPDRFLFALTKTPTKLEVTKINLRTGETWTDDQSGTYGAVNLQGLWDMGWHPSTDTRNWWGNRYYDGLFSRAMSRDELRTLADDPFAPFRPAERRVLVSVAGGGATAADATWIYEHLLGGQAA